MAVVIFLHEITLVGSQVRSDVGGNYKKMLHYALMERDEFVSHVIDEACDGFGTRETLLIDVSVGPCSFFSPKESGAYPFSHHGNRFFRSLLSLTGTNLDADRPEVSVQAYHIGHKT